MEFDEREGCIQMISKMVVIMVGFDSLEFHVVDSSTLDYFYVVRIEKLFK